MTFELHKRTLFFSIFWLLFIFLFFNSRLGKDKAGGAWCPSKQLGPDTSGSEWIQVDLDQLYVVTGIATQGRYGKGLGQEFTEWYHILYSREKIPKKWIQWKNLDGRSVSIPKNKSYLFMFTKSQHTPNICARDREIFHRTRKILK